MKKVSSLVSKLSIFLPLLFSLIPHHALALMVSAPPMISFNPFPGVIFAPTPFDPPTSGFTIVEPLVPEPIVWQPIVISPPKLDFIVDSYNPVIFSPFPFDSSFGQIVIYDDHRRSCIPTIVILDGIEKQQSDCQENSSQVPEPAGLGLLAVGVTALLLQRRKRQH